MELKMYEFEGDVMVWVSAENKDQAVKIFTDYYGKDVWDEGVELYGEEAVREMDNEEIFTYFHEYDGPDENSIGNHIENYCPKPDIFAVSNY